MSSPDVRTPSQLLAAVTKFMLTTFITAVLVAGGGWMTSLSTVMYAASISLFTFAFLPFVLILVGIAIPLLALVAVIFGMIMALVGAAFGVGGAANPDPTLVVDGAISGIKVTREGARILKPYYSWLSRTRHPVLWGGVAGTFLGAVLLWGLITWLVLPGEARTVEILVTTRDAVIQRFKDTRQMPPANAGQLKYQDIGINLPGPVVDGFSQPLEFDVQLPSFRLRSRGFDRRPGADDFCTTGQVELNALQKLIRLKDAAKQLAKKFEFKIENGKLKIAGELKLRDAAKLIAELRCAE